LWLQKNGHSFIAAESPDILCLQETKCSVAKLPDEVKKIAGYKTYWLPADKEGYAGSALFCKKEPIKVSYGISKVYSLIVSLGASLASLRSHFCWISCNAGSLINTDGVR